VRVCKSIFAYIVLVIISSLNLTYNTPPSLYKILLTQLAGMQAGYFVNLVLCVT